MSGRVHRPSSVVVSAVLLLGLIVVLQAQRTHGPGLSGDIVPQAPVAPRQPASRTDGQSGPDPEPTLPAAIGTAITMTWEVLLGEEWVDSELVEVVAANAKRYIVTTTGLHGRSTNDRAVARLLGKRVLMLDSDEIDAAVNTGAVRIVERQNVDYAIPATVVEVQAEEWDSGYDLHRTWIDNLHGIKFRVEMVRDDGEIGRIGMMRDYRFDVSLDGIDFSPPPLREVKADYFESRPFDEQTAGAVDTLGVSGLLHPGRDPIYETLRLRHSAYVTGTQETDPGWFVAQELRGDSGAHVLVLQGDDRRPLPVWLGSRYDRIFRYWPPAWNGMSADEAMFGELRSPQDLHLENGTAARAYECTPQGDLTIEGGDGLRIHWLQAMDCDELITWVDGTRIRVVLAVTGYDRPVAMEVAGAFRRAALGSVP